MAKINIVFNNKSYSIDESSLTHAIADLEAILSGLASGGTPETISVYIGDVTGGGAHDGVRFTAEAGMTWAEFLGSEYNLEDGEPIFVLEEDENGNQYVVHIGTGLYVMAPDEDASYYDVKLTDVISDDVEYLM